MEVTISLPKPRSLIIDTQRLPWRPLSRAAPLAGSLHLSRPLHSPVASLSSSSLSASSEAALARDDLLHLISDQQRGLATQKNPQKRSDIIRAIDALTALGAGMTTTTHQSLSATWRMLWTTEKEQLFIIEKAHLFGTEAGDILQVIDVQGQKLNNVITFPPDGAFLVDSVIEVVSLQRVNFRFTAASLQGSGWSLPVPPFGRGCWSSPLWLVQMVLLGCTLVNVVGIWVSRFDSVYVDEKIRVAKDVRGDYLVVDRAPYSWKA